MNIFTKSSKHLMSSIKKGFTRAKTQRQYILLLFIFAAMQLPGCGTCGWQREYEGYLVGSFALENTTYLVDEEILFDASTSLPDDDIWKVVFEWDFGDGINLTEAGDKLSYDRRVSGAAVTHAYALPGQYVVTLTTSDASGNSSTFTSTIEITRDTAIDVGTDALSLAGYKKLAPRPNDAPIFYLRFEDASDPSIGSLTDSIGGLTVDWVNGTGTYVDGVQGKAIDCTTGDYIKVSNIHTILNNLSGITISFWAKQHAAQDMIYYYDKYGTNTEIQMQMRGNQVLRGSLNTSSTTRRSESGEAFTDYGTKWRHYAITYDGGTVRMYIDGVEEEGNSCPASYSGNLTVSDGDLYIGASRYGEDCFNGYIDEFKIFNRALTGETPGYPYTADAYTKAEPVSPFMIDNELFVGFELWHAPFTARISQYIYVRIPGDITSDTNNQVYATITGGDLGSAITLNDGSGTLTRVDLDSNYNSSFINLTYEERILIIQENLPGSTNDYVLTVSLRTSGGAATLEKRVRRFNKPYSGAPSVGINKNNGLMIGGSSGSTYFPVTPCGLENIYFDQNLWGHRPIEGEPNYGIDIGTEPIIEYTNTAFRGSFAPNDNSVSGWGSYLDRCSSVGMKAIGPIQWDGIHEEGDVRYWNNARLSTITEMVTTHRDHAATLMWGWCDEPDLGPNAPAQVMRAFTYASNKADPNHPVSVNYTQFPWGDQGDEGRRKTSEFSFNAKDFGYITTPLKGIHTGDFYGIDYYPVETSVLNGNTFTENGNIMHKLKTETYNLVPFMSWVETTDIGEVWGSGWSISPAQLKMNIWQNVIAGSKGICWFHRHNISSDANFAVMKEFMTDINILKDIVLSEELLTKVNHTDSAYDFNYNSNYSPTYTLTVTPTGGRVEAMLRRYGGRTYVFAVRVTEIDTSTAQGSTYVGNDPSEATQIAVEFVVSGLTGQNLTATPYESGDPIGGFNGTSGDRNADNGSFNDMFDLNEVIIYEIKPT
ncbi:MAG: PKD domain-containing protein [bacterium]|nr:PKD domain-containing protein [bacterium]